MSAASAGRRASRVPQRDDLARRRSARRHVRHAAVRSTPSHTRSSADMRSVTVWRAGAPPSGRRRAMRRQPRGSAEGAPSSVAGAAEAAQDASHVRARLARPLAAAVPPAPRCRRQSAVAMSPPACSSSTCMRRAWAAIAGPGSNGLCSRCGFQAPAHVAGMNCAMPCAPAGERADASKPLSASSCAASSAGGSCSARAARATSGRSAAGHVAGHGEVVGAGSRSCPAASRRPAPVQPPSRERLDVDARAAVRSLDGEPGATTRPT